MDDKGDATHRRKAAAALRYRRDTDAVPRVTASGRGAIAEKILKLAQEAGIPIREDASLVEVLARLDVGSEIPPPALPGRGGNSGVRLPDGSALEGDARGEDVT